MKHKIKFYITNFFNLILGTMLLIPVSKSSNFLETSIVLMLIFIPLAMFNIPILEYSFKKMLLNTKEYDFKSKFMKKRHRKFHCALEKFDEKEYMNYLNSAQLNFGIFVVISHYAFPDIIVYLVVSYLVYSSVKNDYLHAVNNHIECDKKINEYLINKKI